MRMVRNAGKGWAIAWTYAWNKKIFVLRSEHAGTVEGLNVWLSVELAPDCVSLILWCHTQGERRGGALSRPHIQSSVWYAFTTSESGDAFLCTFIFNVCHGAVIVDDSDVVVLDTQCVHVLTSHQRRTPYFACRHLKRSLVEPIGIIVLLSDMYAEMLLLNVDAQRRCESSTTRIVWWFGWRLFGWKFY